jgi:hypothetical protein
LRTCFVKGFGPVARQTAEWWRWRWWWWSQEKKKDKN